jgi:hypothetical protein
MENTLQYKNNPAAISMSAVVIEKVHRCAECPIRRLAIERPHSIFARLHNWHKTWWPGWKAHQVRTCAFAAAAKKQIS